MPHRRSKHPNASVLCGIAAVCWLWSGCSSNEQQIDVSAGPVWFKDVTASSGLLFIHDPGPVEAYLMPQIMGSGVALFDYDNDDRLDIYLLQGGGPESNSRCRLYRQRQDGTFQDVSSGSGLDLLDYCVGTAVGDINNDGLADVLVTKFRGLNLFLNQGNGTFQEVTDAAGLENPLWCVSATFFDYDRDGWLDLFVCNYVDYDESWPCTSPTGQRDYCSPKVFSGTVSKLFRNLGHAVDPDAAKAGATAVGAMDDKVGFEDVTVEAGLAAHPDPALGVMSADFTGDGWPDLFVANDAQPNRLWVNGQDGSFSDQAVARGVAYNMLGEAEAGMGIAYSDSDGDGLLDLFVTHLTEETNTLWRQGPRGLFTDSTTAAGIATAQVRGTGFGTVMEDFDNDGDMDAAIVNGRVAAGEPRNVEKLGTHWSRYAEPNRLLANSGSGKFESVSQQNADFCGSAGVSRGLACGDLDGDGRLDLVVTGVAQPARIYKNVAPSEGHWLQVRAIDPRWKRDAYGAEVRVRAGGRIWVRHIHSDGSYACSSSPIAHFGLGSLQRITAVEVLWPDGLQERFTPPNVDQLIRLTRGAGEAINP